MSEWEHEILVKEMENRYLGRMTPDNTQIVAVYVDYRKDHLEMNRVEDEYGSIYFMSEIEEE